MAKDNRQQQIQISFRIQDVAQKQFELLTNEWPHEEMQIANALNFAANTNERTVRCTMQLEFKLNDITQLILVVQTTFDFERDSWSRLYSLNDDAWILPVGLVQHLADLTIGAARGILAIRTKEAGIDSVVLPLIHPAQIINANLKLPRTPKADA